MTKIYTLKEPQHVRDDVAMNIALLRYMRFFANGVEVNPLPTETAERYDAILEKIGKLDASGGTNYEKGSQKGCEKGRK